MCIALVSPHGWKIFSVSRELTSGGSDRLFPGRTVSIGSDQVCLPTSSTPLAPVNLLLPVPLIKSLTPISGSSQNRTQSASWWRQPDSGRVHWTFVAACIKNKWNEISNNETKFTFTEWFQNFSTNGTSRENIHETFGDLLTLYLNSHSVTGSLEIFVGQDNFVSSTLISLQCKDCNFCSYSIDVFLNATLVRTIWNHCVEIRIVVEELPENWKTSLSNVPSRLYCHTKVILLPSKT